MERQARSELDANSFQVVFQGQHSCYHQQGPLSWIMTVQTNHGNPVEHLMRNTENFISLLYCKISLLFDFTPWLRVREPYPVYHPLRIQELLRACVVDNFEVNRDFKRRKSTIPGFVPDPFDACGEVGKINRDRNNAKRHTQEKRRWELTNATIMLAAQW